MDRILEQKIKYEQVVKGSQYEGMVKPRLEALIRLEEILNSDFRLFSYYAADVSLYDNDSG